MGVGTTLGVVGGTLGAAGIGAAATTSAANTQAGAANQAAQLQYLSGQQALDFQKQQFAQQQQNIAPWLQAGQGGLGTLSYLLGIPGSGGQGQINNLPSVTGQNTAPEGYYGAGGGFSAAPGQTTVPTATGGPVMTPGQSRAMMAAPGAGAQSNVRMAIPPRSQTTGQSLAGAPPGSAGSFGSLLQGWNQPFVPPTGATEQNDPGYQFRLQQGLGALQNSAAARGGLLSGGTLQGIEQYAQDYASNEYQNVYNRSLGQYQQNYNIFQQNQANEFNRLASLSGIGQTAAGQLGSLGQSAAGNVGNILMGTAGQVGSSLQNAGAARASGYAGLGNIASSTLGGLGQYAMLSGLLGGAGVVQGGIPSIGDTAGIDIGAAMYPYG